MVVEDQDLIGENFLIPHTSLNEDLGRREEADRIEDKNREP
jgi:hypothetical protein